MVCVLNKTCTLLRQSLRRETGLVLVLIALVVLHWVPRRGGPIDLRWDGSVYYLLGTSLAEGKGYRLLNEPGEIEAVQYPPLLPLVVAAHQRVLGTSDPLLVGPWLKFSYLLMAACFAVAVYRLGRAYLSPGYALLAALVCVLYFYTYYWSNALYTEIPFALVTTMFVLTNRKSDQAGYSVITGLLGAAAYLLRTAGAALLAAWVAESLLRRRFKQAALRAAAALLPLVLWQAHIARVKDSEAYRRPAYAYQRAPYQYSNVTYIDNARLIDPFRPERGKATAGDLSRRIPANLAALPMALGEAVSAPVDFWRWLVAEVLHRAGLGTVPPWTVVLPIALLAFLVVAGMVLLAARREWFFPLFFGATALLICLTPWPEQVSRYLMALTPLFAVSLCCALAFLGEWCAQRRPWRKARLLFTAAIPTMIFLAQGFTLAHTYAGGLHPATYHNAHGDEVAYRLFSYSPSWRALDRSLEWLQKRASPGDVIATTTPHAAYLRTGRKAVLPPMEADPEQAQCLLDAVPVKYVVVDSLGKPGISERYAVPVVQKHPALWKCVFVAPGNAARVYERVP